MKNLAEFHRILLALIISLALGVYAFRKEALSASGTIAAILVGLFIFILGGTDWFVLLAVFFLSSVFFTRFHESQKSVVVQDFAKGGVRDFWQVLANGGIAALIALAFFYYREPVLYYAFLGVIATVTADTWATELGILGKGKPRLITTGQRVPVGTSGAISSFGTLVSAAGSAAIAVSALLALNLLSSPLAPRSFYYSALLFTITVLSGVFGALFDSLLGATVQSMYYCVRCKKETEKTLHHCGQKTSHIRGFAWFDNDIVNLASSVAGALVAALLYILLFLR